MLQISQESPFYLFFESIFCRLLQRTPRPIKFLSTVTPQLHTTPAERHDLAVIAESP